MNLLEHLSQGEIERERFYIENNDQAMWAMRKIAKSQRQIAENNKAADHEVQRVEDWRAKVNDTEQRDVEYFEAILAAYYEQQKALDPTLKTINLPTGKIRSVKQQPEWVRDEETLLCWAKHSAGEFVRVTESVQWGELKKSLAVNGDVVVFKESGEVVPGVKAVERPPLVKIEVES